MFSADCTGLYKKGHCLDVKKQKSTIYIKSSCHAKKLGSLKMRCIKIHSMHKYKVKQFCVHSGIPISEDACDYALKFG